MCECVCRFPQLFYTDDAVIWEWKLFISSCLVHMSFISFSWFVALSRTSISNMGHSCLILNLTRIWCIVSSSMIFFYSIEIICFILIFCTIVSYINQFSNIRQILRSFCLKVLSVSKGFLRRIFSQIPLI